MGGQYNNDDKQSKPGQQSPVLSVKSQSGTPPGTPPPPYTLAARIASRAEKIKGTDLDLAAKIAKEEEANGVAADKSSQFYLKHEFKAYLQRFISPESDKYYSYYFWSRYLFLIFFLVLFILVLGYFSLLYGSSHADNAKKADNGAYGIAYPLQESEARLPSAQAHIMTASAIKPVIVSRPSETTTTETVATNNGQDAIEKMSSTQSSESTEAPEASSTSGSPSSGIEVNESESPFQSLIPKLNSVRFIMKSIAQSVDGSREPVVKVIESHSNNVTPTDVRQLTSNFMNRMVQILQAFANRDEQSQPQRYTPDAPEVSESEPDYDDDDDDMLPGPFRHFKVPMNPLMSSSEPLQFGINSASSADESPKSVVLFLRREPQPQSMFGQPGQSAVHPLLQAIAAIARQASQQNAMEQQQIQPQMMIPQPQVQRVMMIVRQDEPEEAESESEPQMHQMAQPQIMFQRSPAPFIQRILESRREFGQPMMATQQQPQIRQFIRIPQAQGPTHLPMMMMQPQQQQQQQQIPLLALMRMHAAASAASQLSQQLAAHQQQHHQQPQEQEYDPQQSVYQEPLPRQAMIIFRKNSEMGVPQQEAPTAQNLFEFFRPDVDTSDDTESNDQTEQPEYPTMNFLPTQEQPKEPEMNPGMNAYRLEQWGQYNQMQKDLKDIISPKAAEQPEESVLSQPTENEPETIPQQYSPDTEAEKQPLGGVEEEVPMPQGEPQVEPQPESQPEQPQSSPQQPQEQPVEQAQPAVAAIAAEPTSADSKDDEQSPAEVNSAAELPAEPRISRD